MTDVRTMLLLVIGWPTVVEADDRLSSALDRGRRRIETAATNYTGNRDCFSCHHQAVPMFALQSMADAGRRIDRDVLVKQITFTLDTFKPNLAEIRQGRRVPGGNTMAAYALYTLAVVGHPADDVTDALVDYLIVKQDKDGSWPPILPRLPSEGSRFTNAALAIPALKRYGRAAESARNRDKLVRDGIERSRIWLEGNRGEATEDRVFRLRALQEAGSKNELIRSAERDLWMLQRFDGGWAQTSDRDSDAYATGSALTSLIMTGSAPTDSAFAAGIDYLLRTQRDDGAWIVETRIRPVQRMFDNGDPGGPSQFISTAGTAWALTALARSDGEIRKGTDRR